MSIFKEINAKITDIQDLLENRFSTLSPNEINRLVDYVIDELKTSKNKDVQELAALAMEDLPGVETMDSRDVTAYVKKIEQGVVEKQKLNKIPKANRNSKDFKELMSG